MIVLGESADSALVGVARALEQLSGATSVQALFCVAARALCESAGFGRAAVFTLQGGALVAESVHPPGENGLSPRRLGPGLRETEVLRRRAAILVEDVDGDPRAVGLLAGTESFVAAPVICHEQCVGLVHADPGALGPPVTERDRDALAAFAVGFGYALERCVLLGRMRIHTERLLALMRSAEASVTELDSHEFAPAPSAPRIATHTVRNGNDLRGLLTRRELEVVAMLAEGETNARIAQRLVVSEDTVKSHVKHILRKLGVHNRSQAVSRYFQAHAGS